ncbi:helix-turn-helix domain-containing protein [Paenibacillus oralis]|uniref:Helix-turn-helix domain-containing protein n=1 Tax=Paenibacillus oralis TaxID=2490856 RepID=A0A3P3U4L1_9BACL|nr:helix-turn-helix domain-containing protein [Paenibacillus oralis]RRJ65100.1 helix-turn-helix domain-containing protein [Paenibacillus oralis]
MNSTAQLLFLAQQGDKEAEAVLIERYEPVINKYAKLSGIIDEDCKQQLTISFILAVRRFDLNRYH